MKKKFLSIAVIAVVMTVMLAVSAFAAIEVEVSGDLYDGGTAKKTATLSLDGIPENATNIVIGWVNLSEDNISLDKYVGQSVKVTADKQGDVSVMCTYSYLPAVEEGTETPAPVTGNITKNFSVGKYELDKIEATCSQQYLKDQTINKGHITVVATYTDGSTDDEFSDFDYNPKTATTDGETITVTSTGTYAGKTDTFTIEVTPVSTKDLVTAFSIDYPKATTEFEIGKDLKKADVEILLTYLDDTTSTVGLDNEYVTYSGISFTNGKYTFSENDATTPPELTVKYGDFSAQKVALKVVKPTPTKTIIGIDARPIKTEYSKGDSITKSSDLKVYLKYSDNSEEQLETSKFTVSPSPLNTTGDAITVTVKLSMTGVAEFTDTYEVKVKKVSTATEIDNDTDDYELWDKEDIKIKVGDVLNTDIKWYDVFKEVRVKIDGEWKTIDHRNDLENYPGVELLLRVYNKDSEEIKSSYINSDGTVRIQLCFKNGSGSVVTDNSVTIREYVSVSDAGCTVTAYRSKSTSTTTGTSKSYEELDDALDLLEVKSDTISTLGVSSSYRSNFAVTIKLGADQNLGSYSFRPDHEQVINIDLNGHKLELDSDWIDYDSDNDEIVVNIINTSTTDGKLIYDDKDITLIVAKGTTLEFKEDVIPMDSDAAVTVSVYKSSSTSSNNLFATKVYDDIDDALEDIKDLDEVKDKFGVTSSYEDDFVVRIKLSEDQTISSSGAFEPDYENKMYIDLNGYEFKVKTDWIDFGDCEDLTVSVSNSNADKDAKLIYSDKSSATISIKKSDSALVFKEDDVPGIYDITVSDSISNGRVTANKETVVHGGTVTFTITPDTGYAISTVKAGTKSITTSTEGYSVNSKGVGTYEMKNITGDVTISATFKKASSTSSSGSSSSSSSSSNWTNPFSDVTKNAQYYDAVEFVCSEGLFNGMTATKFEPMTTMTRAMFVTVLGRLAEVDTSKFSGSSFTDVSRYDQQISWAAPYIEWAVQNGITNGTGNNKFSPNAPISHQEMYTFMYRYALFIEQMYSPLTGVSLSSIRDANEVATWAEEGVKFASKHGILVLGSGNKLTPADNALRCELAMLLQGFCTKVMVDEG